MQKIFPFIWFDNNAEEAINFYVDTFNAVVDGEKSEVISIHKYPDNVDDEHMKGMEDKILHATFSLAGYRFKALDGGPIFNKTPAISFFVNCSTEEEVQHFWDVLSQGGKELMPLQKYDFSEKYGWLEDKYGVSWQITLSDLKEKIIPSFLFVQDMAGRASEAIEFYASIFPDSKQGMTAPYPPEMGEKEGSIMYGELTLCGQQFTAMDSGQEHLFGFTEAISLYVECEDQKEVDHYWQALSAVKEAEQCGWLKDKFGVSWQIIPKQLEKLMSRPNKEKSGRVMEAMLQMKKIEVEKLEQAYQG